jgi:hypothetical protein
VSSSCHKKLWIGGFRGGYPQIGGIRGRLDAREGDGLTLIYEVANFPVTAMLAPMGALAESVSLFGVLLVGQKPQTIAI